MTSYIYNMVDTWNNGATTFTAIKMDVTDSASNAASLLMDLQVGTVSKFKVQKDGSIFIPSGSTIGNGSNVLAIGGGNIYPSSAALTVGTATVPFSSMFVSSTAQFSWSSGGTADLILTRRAAANLRFGAADAAAPVAQTLSVQSVVAGTTNTAGTNLTITGSQGTGTGAGGSIIFQVAPAGSTGTAQNALSTALTIDSTRLATFTGSVSVTGGVSTGATLSIGGTSVVLKDAGVLVLQILNNAQNTGVVIDAATDGIAKFRLRGNAAFASVQGKLTTETAYTAGTVVATGYLTLYDSTGTAYRVPCLV